MVERDTDWVERLVEDAFHDPSRRIVSMRSDEVEVGGVAMGRVHLTFAEQADVELGLKTYCAVSPAHAARFRELYLAVAPDRRVLASELVDELAPEENNTETDETGSDRAG